MGRSSLQFKVVLGYYAISAMAFCLSLFTLIELRLVEQRLETGQQVVELLNNVLEMRRFEKNYLLYRQSEDIRQLEQYAIQTHEVLQSQALPATVGREGVSLLQRSMEEYSGLIHHEFRQEEPSLEVENRIRHLGKMVVTAAEEIAAEEGRQVRRALEKHRLTLLFAVIVVVTMVIGMGRVLSQMVVLPLQRMEESMAGVASGQLASIHLESADREILSLTQAFNRVLHELELRQKHLLRSEKLAALGTLLSGVAHELNNPLSNISTSCQILEEELDSPDVTFKKELVAQIDEQTRRARDIVRSLLDFARDREFRQASHTLDALMREVVRFSKGTIPPQVQVTLNIPPHMVILGDRQRLQQAFINLLKNAVEAIQGTGQVIIRAVSHEANALPMTDPLFARNKFEQGRNWAEIQIQDSGSGIPPELLSRIFDPFFTTKAVGKGSGLGLAVVFEVVEEHGGAIVVDSVVGQGTTFRLRLPLAPIPERAPA